MMGVRVLPSLLCYLPQTKIYQEVDKDRLEFSNEMVPEYMITGHEICSGYGVKIDDEYNGPGGELLITQDSEYGFTPYSAALNQVLFVLFGVVFVVVVWW